MAKRNGNKETRKPKQIKADKVEAGSVAELTGRSAGPAKRR